MSTTPPPPPPPPGAEPPPPPPPPPPGDEPWRAAAEATGPAGQPLASPWLRVLARLLDGLIVGIVFGSIFSAILLPDDDTAGLGGIGADTSFARLYLVSIVSVAVGFVWDAVMTKQFGGTPMKLAFGMRVVRADNGHDVEWSHAIKRWAVPGAFTLLPLPVLPAFAGLIVIIISLVFLFTRPLRQTVWDLFGGTLVVRKT